jgi:hypothetical protein
MSPTLVCKINISKKIKDISDQFYLKRNLTKFLNKWLKEDNSEF